MTIIQTIIADIEAIGKRIKDEIGLESHLTALQASQLLEGAAGELAQHPDANPPVIQTAPPEARENPTKG